jgi:nicotinamidase/pyrazinamidase
MIADFELKTGDALLVVDVQTDFCPGGALPIEDGDRVIPTINEWIRKISKHHLPVFASRDWHPRHHTSFTSEGGQWPPHCIQDTEGAGFHKNLELPESTVVITKGVRFDQDQNSAFDQTGLETHMQRTGIRRLFVAGLALDVCVLATVVDASKMGFEVVLISDATRPVNARNGREALAMMRAAGAIILEGNWDSKRNVSDKSAENAAADIEVCINNCG